MILSSPKLSHFTAQKKRATASHVDWGPSTPAWPKALPASEPLCGAHGAGDFAVREAGVGADTHDTRPLRRQRKATTC